MIAYRRDIVAIVLFLLVSFGNTSCRKSEDTDHLWYEYDYVFNSEGRAKDYTIKRGKPYVVTYVKYTAIDFVLRGTAKGVVSEIMEHNPDWEFVFYYGGELSDSTKIINALKEKACSADVIFDPEMKYLTGNGNKNPELTGAVGYICDVDGRILGMGVIGDSRSIFLQAFRAANDYLKR